MCDDYPSVKLDYTIYKCSSFSGSCIPENIMVEDPTDQLSRWFTDNTSPNQYIMLKLNDPAIVETILFGKYMKAHVSDLKKFQIFGGTDENNLSLLLTSGLKNDNTSETFRLRHLSVEGFYLPIVYLKIVPQQSWGPPYNYTIWHIACIGKNDKDFMRNVMQTINLRKEEEAVRILLKHLQRRRYKEAFEALSRESGVRLEGDTQARLWDTLVENGDFEMAEQIFEEAVSDGELEWYMSWQPYSPRWRQISPCSALVEERLCRPLEPAPAPPPHPADLPCTDRDWINASGSSGLEGGACESVTCTSVCSCKPGPRGGHQLVLDSVSNTLYLFGGWNGTDDLDDMWSYSIDSDRWSLLCAHSELVGGPSPRSCHKMVFDPIHKKLYTLGRYLDNAHRHPRNMKSDLYVYDIVLGEWSLICEDTSEVGGPRLVFDHQMCIDTDTQTIYVFGGRVLPTTSEEVSRPLYSGLYAYYIGTCTWQLLLNDMHKENAPQPRVGHSMLFHPVRRRLYIFAGQRNKEVLLDLWWWDVNTGECAPLASAAPTRPPPAAGFTQRATIDPDTDEVYVLSGMSKELDKRVFNTLWVFSLQRLTWSCVYRNERASPADPRPRFAHQLVYDHIRKIHYLFGGNPGNQSSPRLRLDDLWALELVKPTLCSVTGRARAALREARYRQMVADADPVEALDYLRHAVHGALDHNDPEQVQHFQKLPTVLFSGSAPPPTAELTLTPPTTRLLARRKARAAANRGGAQLSLMLAAVLGADDNVPESPEPFEDVVEPEPETWDVGDSGDDAEAVPDSRWEARAVRVTLYENLCQYFKPSTVPPKVKVADLVTF